jgi:hypothetical protein
MARERQSADERKLERARANAALLGEIVATAKTLCSGWQATGFYDRQDAVQALALHDAIAAYESGEKT